MRTDAIVLAVLLAACGREAGTHSASFAQSGTLGPLDAEIAQHTFAEISSVAALPDGRVIVIDAQEKAIFLVDFQTGSTKEVGRQGDGPREYRNPSRARAGAGDTLWVSDWGSHVFRLISPSGEMLEKTIAWPASASPAAWTRRGVLYAAMETFQKDSIPLARFSPRDPPPVTNAQLLQPVATGSRQVIAYKADSLVRLSTGSPKTTIRDSPTNAAGEGIMEVSINIPPYGMGDGWVLLDDGTIAVIRSSPYRVEIIDSTGRVTVGPSIDHEVFKNPWHDENPKSPEVKPAFYTGAPFEEEPQASPANTIWVRRTTANDSGPHEFDVFDRSARLVNHLALPAGTRLVGFTPGFVYVAKETDGGLRLQRFAYPK